MSVPAAIARARHVMAVSLSDRLGVWILIILEAICVILVNLFLQVTVNIV